jgi:hypothetical protein
MDETVAIGIASRPHRDSVALYRDSVALYRDSVAPHPRKPAPALAFSEVSRSLPFFYLFLPADVPSDTVDNLLRQARGTPSGFPHLRRLPLPNNGKPPVRLGSLGGFSEHRYTNRSAASRLRPLCAACAFGLPGAKGRRDRAVRESDPGTQNF